MDQATAQESHHATTVAVDGKGLMILGPAGSGKSTLAMQMVALGADLVADDRTLVHRDGTCLLVSAPDPISGLIEARGIGILRVPSVQTARLDAVLDLTQEETERLPEPRFLSILGIDIPLYRRPKTDALAAALVVLLKHGRHA